MSVFAPQAPTAAVAGPPPPPMQISTMGAGFPGTPSIASSIRPPEAEAPYELSTLGKGFPGAGKKTLLGQ